MAQAVGFAVAIVVAGQLALPAGLDPRLAGALVQALIALVAVRLMGLSAGWQLAQPIFALALLPELAAALPSWGWLAAFAVLLAVFWNSFGEAVPLYLSNGSTARALADLLPPGARMVDLGSGTGGLLLRLARLRPDVRLVGVESAPLPHLVARVRLAVAAPANLRLIWGDLWQVDLGEFDVVYVFLSPEPMPRILKKACAEMAGGGLLVSNSFAVGGRSADERMVLDDRRRTELHLWRMDGLV